MWKNMGRTGVGLLALAAGLASAGEWQMAPWARASIDYNDNIRFATSDEEQSTGAVVELGGRFRSDTEAVRTSITPKLVFRRYDSSANVDSNDQYLNFQTRLLRPRGEWGLSVDAVRNTTLTSELLDTGIVSANRRREEYGITPSFQYALSELSSVQVSLGRRMVRYASGSAGLVDYDYDSVNAGYTRRLSERLDWHLSANYGHYEAKDVDSRSDTSGLQLGMTRRLSERTTFSASVGGYRTDSSLPGVSTSKSGASADLSLQHRTQLSTLGVTLSRNVVPSGVGEVQEDTSLNLSANRRLSQRLSLGLSASVIRRGAIRTGSGSDRDYYTVRPSFSWHLWRTLYLSGSYSYSRQKFDASNGTAEANAVSVGLEYRPRQVTLY